MFMETHLVSGKKSDILVEGTSVSVKHGTPFNISINSSQLGGATAAGLLFSLGASSSIDSSETPSDPRVFTAAGASSKAVVSD